jgi:hypothetical protein
MENEIRHSVAIIRYVEISLGCVSILSLLFIITVFLLNRNKRCFDFELIVYLSISSLINTISFIINFDDGNVKTNKGDWVCESQAFVMIWTDISQFIWSNLIIFYMYKNLKYHRPHEQSGGCLTRLIYNFLGFVLPMIFSIIGLFFDLLGPSGKWCWVASQVPDLSNEVFGLIIYIFIWILIVINIIGALYINIKFKTQFSNENNNSHNLINSHRHSQSDQKCIESYINQLCVYPTIHLITWIPCTVNRAISLFWKDDVNTTVIEVIEIISIICISTQGLAYAIAYGSNPQVKELLKNYMKKIKNCGCLRGSRKDIHNGAFGEVDKLSLKSNDFFIEKSEESRISQ